MVAVCSPSYRGDLSVWAPDALLSRTVLSAGNSLITWPICLAAAGMDRSATDASVMFSDAGMLVQAAVEGQGIALARPVLAHDDLRAGHLVAVSNFVLPSPFSYYAVTSRHEVMSNNAKEFLAWIKADQGYRKHHQIVLLAFARHACYGRKKSP